MEYLGVQVLFDEFFNITAASGLVNHKYVFIVVIK